MPSRERRGTRRRAGGEEWEEEQRSCRSHVFAAGARRRSPSELLPPDCVLTPYDYFAYTTASPSCYATPSPTSPATRGEPPPRPSSQIPASLAMEAIVPRTGSDAASELLRSRTHTRTHIHGLSKPTGPRCQEDTGSAATLNTLTAMTFVRMVAVLAGATACLRHG